MNFVIDALGRGTAWTIDPSGYLLSQLYLTPAQYQARTDLVMLAPPTPAKGHCARFVDGAWIEEPREIPKEPAATWEHIRQWRDTHEVASVTTTFGTFDADPRSEARMAGSIEEFDSLPTLNAEGRLTWKRADNSYLPLTKAELQQVYDEMKTNRAQRGAVLHVRAEALNAMDPKPTVTQLKDLTFWLP